MDSWLVYPLVHGDWAPQTSFTGLNQRLETQRNNNNDLLKSLLNGKLFTEIRRYLSSVACKWQCQHCCFEKLRLSFRLFLSGSVAAQVATGCSCSYLPLSNLFSCCNNVHFSTVSQRDSDSEGELQAGQLKREKGKQAGLAVLWHEW